MKKDYSKAVSTLISNIDEKYRYYIGGGVLLFLFLLDYFIIMGPQLNNLTKMTPQCKLMEEDIQKAETDIQNKENYQKQVKDLSAKITEEDVKIRSKEEVPLTLEYISRLADENNIRIDQIKPNTAGQNKLLENKGRRYFAVPIVLEAKGGYHDVGKFLNQIESGDVFFNIKDFSMTSLGESKYHKIKLTLEAITYEKL
ncbi:MAG: type 4a pilus biogenesis protein PilO [Candidatus Omnitrophota bacterium]|nr:type 4a pilus biogenesis protein PilO [Candidatus Omnitrophota bacterium]